MKKKISLFLAILVLFGVIAPIANVRATVYGPDDRLSNGFFAPIAYSPHHVISEVNPWGDQIHVELQYEMNYSYSSTNFYPKSFSVYSQKNVIEDERFQTEESRDINAVWFIPVQMAFWADKLGEFVPETQELRQSFDLKLSEPLNERNADVIYYGEEFQNPTSGQKVKDSGKIDYSECKQQILSGEADSVVCEARLLNKDDIRYFAREMSEEELESPEYKASWETVKNKRKELNEEKFKEYYTQLEKLRTEVDRLRSELAENMDDVVATELAIESLKTTLEAISGSEDMIEVVKQLQTEIQDIHGQYDTAALREQLQLILDNQTKLQAELNASRVMQETLTEQLNTEKEEKAGLETKITELEARIAELTKELDDEKKKVCNCPTEDKKEEVKPVFPSCPSIPAVKDEDASDGSVDKNVPILKPDDNTDIIDTITKDEVKDEKDRGDQKVINKEANQVLNNTASSNTAASSTPAQEVADSYGSMAVNLAQEKAQVRPQSEVNKIDNQVTSNNILKGEEKENIEVPSLGENEEDQGCWLFLIPLVIFVILICLVRRMLSRSGRNQKA